MKQTIIDILKVIGFIVGAIIFVKLIILLMWAAAAAGIPM